MFRAIDAEWLRENTRPEGARKPAAARAGSPEDDRDRLWTLLVRRHALLERAGGYFHGAAMGEHVPPLRSRVRAHGPAEDETPGPPDPPPPAPDR